MSPQLSPVVAGTWRMHEWGWSPAERLAWIEQCVELGVTSFDHADIYGGYSVETLFGEALRLATPALRQRLQIVTKCGIRLVSPARPLHRLKSYDTSAAHLRASVEASLRALGVERIELLLIHRPDPLLDPAEVAGAIDALRREGKLAHFGVSNHTPSQASLLQRALPLAANQIEFSPLHLQPLHDGTLDQCLDLGIRPMAWSPLGGGRLLNGHDERERRVRDALERIAAEHGVSIATAAYAWILRHPSRPLPITGTRRIDAIREALAATSLRLDRESWFDVWQASAGHEVA
ncbi:aldo/keto reductase [Rivibacter subsaxonicus]|uniref:Putative oxidoreductase n=1 Tax=Rivibacter subsaxonicus TaxID=457575 RepID=A0A4Q7VPL3_9BURK|nr:aldo/keto reductase [Rivibacter subsaxonicus]RZT98078.1 putative oxidoreductase [Rivibacter subsaxonicus]